MKRTAILIAAHNEAAVIAKTLQSALGQADIFVASDNSTDATAEIARKYTPYVLEVSRGGKGRAIRALIEHYDITQNYRSFLILDADTLLGKGAVRHFYKALGRNAGAVGVLRPANGGLCSYWRSVLHLMTAKVYRRGMAATNTIPIMSGTCAIWSTRAFRYIDYEDTPVEDMDFTYQIHRKKLGRIVYSPHSVVYTQEPLTLSDYCKQMLRWLRGYWLTTAKYKAPFGRQALDAGQALFIFEAVLNWARIAAVPLAAVDLAPLWILLTFLYDLVMLLIYGTITAIYHKNWRIAAVAPFFIGFFLLDSLLNLYSLLTYRKLKTGTWKSPTRLALDLSKS